MCIRDRCIKLAAVCKTSSPTTTKTHNNKNKKSSSLLNGVDGCGVDQMNGHCDMRVKLESNEWIEGGGKECCSDEEGEPDDDVDDDVDDAGDDAAGISYKELFRMATLGGATGTLR